VKKIFLLTALLLIFTQEIIGQSTSLNKIINHYNIELFMHTANADGETIVFEVRALSSPIWSPSDPYLIDTDNFNNPASLTIYGNDTTSTKGWHTDRSERIYDGNPCLQWAYKYEIRVSGEINKLEVETMGFFGWDEDVMYDYDTDKYYHWQNDTKVLGSEITGVLNMRDYPEYLQPTPPRNFTCTNSGSSGQHPNFSWVAPSGPTGVSFKYKIYRNTGGGAFYCIVSGLTSTSWSDNEISINKSGNSFWYYATAYTDYSPSESNESTIAKIIGDPSKSLPGHPETDNQRITTNQEMSELSFYAYPNPFNSTTKISYFIPEDGYVRLSVSNITGRQITELINEKQSIGTYQLNFSGQSLASGLYLVQLQLGNKLVTRKILLFK